MNIFLHSTAMPFGKHKGTAMRDVPASYKLWLLEECADLETKFPYLQHYLETHEHAIRQGLEDNAPDYSQIDYWDL